MSSAKAIEDSGAPGTRTGKAAAAQAAAGAIRIRGARQNNLTGIDVEIPRNRLVAITGVSGSGKSSLAFDTLFREGQRRFLETLSAYARQFLGRMEKPDVDHVEGLSPAIAVDQKAIQRGPRSTVGTITEVYDYLRVLWARAGVAHCPEHGSPLAAQSAASVLDSITSEFDGEPVHVLAPLIRDRKGSHRALLEDLGRKGFVRVRVDGVVQRIEGVTSLERYRRHTIEVVVDRLTVREPNHGRLREAVDTALELGGGDLVVLGRDGASRSYSTLRACPTCGHEAPPLEPRLFSFNSPHGGCAACDGLGVIRRPSERLVVGDPSLSIRDGALAVTRASGGALLFPRVDFRLLDAIAEAHGFDLDTPWCELRPDDRRVILRGTGEERFEDQANWNGKRFSGSVKWKRRYKGVLGALEETWKKGSRRKMVARFLESLPCTSCSGSRLNESANAVTVGGLRIAELLSTPIGSFGARLDAVRLSPRESKIAEGLLREIRRRVAFLDSVGLGYLGLDRAADTLSGGEAQRIRLAAQLGAGLQGVLYVLDEPSIGLHPRDHGRLFGALEGLRDGGNTVVVVEHDAATLRSADWLIEIGPGPGRHGGQLVAEGTPAEVARGKSLTAALLRGELAMPAPGERRAGNGNRLRIEGARGFNLTGVDLEIPLGTLTVVSGVSGSGKSTLVHHTLQRAVSRHLGREAPAPETVDRILGLEHIEEMVFLSSSPIGRTPRSNPATYSGAFTPIRDLFAGLGEARVRGWTPGRFSFNVAGGRCEACQGAGARFVELQFLAPVTVPCEECGGHRFQEETLGVRYHGHSIADVLGMTIEEARDLFRDIPKVMRPLQALCEVGLGYLTLGQPSTTLSGGEAQRVKLAKHLQKHSRRHTLYLLDEPTTGLHHQDVQRLVGSLQRLVEQGHTVVVIEHMLELVQAADYVIDLGPEGGDGGGRLVIAGTPEQVEACEESHTGAAMRAEKGLQAGTLEGESLAEIAGPLDRIVVRNARTHNLKGVTVEIPRESLTVVTGPSGSGKSSLALDTIHATGRQRFVESLNTYARQFLSSRDRPPVDGIDGLGPSIAVESRTASGHPRSTVATTTEIHDHLRVLWARAGVRRCPEHGEALVRSDAGGVARQILADCEGLRGWIVAPLLETAARDAASRKEARQVLAIAYGERRAAWMQAGFVRVLADGAELRIAEHESLPAGTERVDLVVDRLSFEAAGRGRIAEALESAESLNDGRVSVVTRKAAGRPSARREYSTHGICTSCGFRLAEELEPRHFSFNTHVGACPDCDGLGESWQCSRELLVDAPELPLVTPPGGGPTAISGKLGRYLTKGKGYYEHLLRAVAKAHRIDLSKPVASLSEKQAALLFEGRGARTNYKVEIDKQGSTFELHESFRGEWPGLLGHVDAWHQKAEDPEWRQLLEGFMTRQTCALCQGERLAPGPRAVTLGRKRLPEALSMSVAESAAWLSGMRLKKSVRESIQPILDEVQARVALLERVGLGYITLDRKTSSLSGGEARRVRLSANLGSRLVGVCYVLDEPTVGLHPQDIDRLTDALLELRDGGNTVLVVEHDESLMRRADHIVDLGPGAGHKGGRVVEQGTPAQLAKSGKSVTSLALRGELRLEREGDGGSARGRVPESVLLTGARLHNLRGVRFEARFGDITGVCGPSGSGKSSLVLQCLVPALRGEKPLGRWKSVRGAAGGARRVVLVDARPIGRTPKSIPATAVGLMDPLRELFARTPEARMRGLKPFSFSFNSKKGRCPACDGLGATKVEMQFLADLWMTCEECDGARYRPETLEVRYRGKNIADVLAMEVDEAAELFAHVPKIATILTTLREVGLGYMSLGQSSTTLSAGEAQRIKLASELCRAQGGARSILVLDEPTTGLAKSDVCHLFRVLTRLADRGDAVIVVEHHTAFLEACDRLVELGPAGGAAGGKVIAVGTPEELRGNKDSVTGPWLQGGGPARGETKARAKRSGKGSAAKARCETKVRS